MEHWRDDECGPSVCRRVLLLGTGRFWTLVLPRRHPLLSAPRAAEAAADATSPDVCSRPREGCCRLRRAYAARGRGGVGAFGDMPFAAYTCTRGVGRYNTCSRS